jgi:hypothetical protein
VKRTIQLLSLASVLAVSALAEKTVIQGNYIEARTADVFTGPCFSNSEMNLTGDTAVLGWHIKQGAFDGVKLDGLSVVGVVRGQATFGDPTTTAYPVKSILIVDERATVEQRLALTKFAAQMGGDLFQNVLRVATERIEFEIPGGNIHRRQAKMTAGTLARIETRAMVESDQVCHNEELAYLPMTKTDHAMEAFAIEHEFKGKDLGTTWSSPSKRSAFVGSFRLER